MTGQPIYIFDLDGTLANCEHRLHHIAEGPKDWDAFYEACDLDNPIQPTIDILNALADVGAHVLVMTSRADSVITKTVEWLWKHHVKVHEMRMRPHGDHTHDDVLKQRWYDELSPDEQGRVKAVFEDRTRVVRMWRELGLTCYQVTDGGF